ncbi:MAG: extracellular solute-binding protein [Spirochaetia bacterium]|nr:extracellular solute-binding protein [Spirochaetia bacterium]
MKKQLVMGIAVLAIATGVTFANGQGETTAASTKTKQEITFWNIATENPDKMIMDYTVDKYNKRTDTDYTVKEVPTQNDSYKEKIIIAMSSGQCPDMYTSWSGGPMNEYIESGFAQPLDDLVKNSDLPDKLMPAALAQASYNGHIYAIPVLNVALSGIFYNKEIFAKYNLQVPKTIGELEKDCDVLVAHGIIPFALANKTKWTGSMYFMNLAARKGGLEPFRKAVAGTGTFEDECFIYAGQKIQEWVKKGYFPEGVNSLNEDDGQARQLMYQNKAAMTCNGSWYTGNFQTDSKEFYKKIGWFAFPALEGSSADASIQIGTIGDQFISFNCTGDKLKAAFDCISHYADEDSIKLMVENGKIPPVKDVSQYLTDPVTKSILAAASKASSVQLWYDQYLPPAVAQTHLNTCQELFGLTMTPQEAAAKFEASMKEYLASK